MSKFDWSLYPKAEAFLQTKVAQFLSQNQTASKLASAIEKGTSTYFFDWIDHITVSAEAAEHENLAKLGFKENKEGATDDDTVYRVLGSTLFPILLSPKKSTEVALRVEDIEKFQAIHTPEAPIEGQPNSPLRKLLLSEENNRVFSAVERNGSSAYIVEDAKTLDQYVEALKVFGSRKRKFASDEEGLLETRKLIKSISSKLDKPRLADAFFRAERVYWTNRNTAAKVQKARQDELGLGWSNHDHHTFRSSRPNFQTLIEIFELMGLKPRERFHAGAQAGWGAQILEDEFGRVVVFADVDLDAAERETDFVHQGLASKEKLGTVGLWVALHGESILQAGMHHLAARFRFDNIREDLKQKGVAMMKPFSDFPFLKQAFTEGQNWVPEKQCITLLEKNGQLSLDQAARFAENGTIGSHLENIHRGQGFKGFNQESVSAIIKWTDPRLQKELYA